MVRFPGQARSVAYETVQMDVFLYQDAALDKNSAYSKYIWEMIFKVPTPQKLSQIIDKLEDVANC